MCYDYLTGEMISPSNNEVNAYKLMCGKQEKKGNEKKCFTKWSVHPENRKSVLQSGGPALRFVKHFATTSNKARQLLGFQ